jgi:hydrogenase-1 operon protein HyaF
VSAPDVLSRPRRLPVLGGADGLALAPLSSLVPSRQEAHLSGRGDLSPAVRALLGGVRDALLAPPRTGTAVFALDDCDPGERAALRDLLGSGEVSIVVQGAARYEIEETALPGVYRVHTQGAGYQAEHLEVGPVPAVVVAAAERGTSTELPIDDPPPPGLMNAQPLLAELRHRMDHRGDDANHVVSLSLLPLNEADAAYLARALGAGPVRAESRGYGTCRVALTSRRGIWAVQYFNVTGSLILDTLEVGSVPAALVAAPMDLEDSGLRLGELLEEGPS